MQLRTIEVPDAQGHLHNAVLLCGFTANVIDRQFLVYSLNEKISDDLVKIYLAPIEGAGSKLSMCGASSEVLMSATLVLKSIIRDACSPQVRQSKNTYALLDLTDIEIQCTEVQSHHSLKISENWLMKLLTFNPEAPSRPDEQAHPEALQAQVQVHVNRTEYQTMPTQSFLTPSPSTTALSYRVISRTPTLEEAPVDGGNEPEHAPSHSEKIETNLTSLISSLTQHKETLLGKFVKLDERLRELEQREQALEARERSLIGREEELIAGMNALQMADEQLRVIMREA